MFCQHCGAARAAEVAVCSGCGAAAITTPHADIGAQLKAASGDALGALKTLARNPVSGILDAFQALGPRRALVTGVAFGIVYDICALFGTYLFFRRGLGGFGGSLDGVPFTTLVKLVFLGCVPLVAFSLASLVTRRVFQGRGSVEADVFIAGAALLPAAAVALLGAMLGTANAEVIAVLVVFSLVYTILILFAGATKLSQVSEAVAIPSVALMLLATAWIAKVIFVAVLF
jgi:hypothetical protein